LLVSCGGGGDIPNSDTTAPTIISKIPENRTIDVDELLPIKVKFSEDIITVTEANISLFKYTSQQPNNFVNSPATLIKTKLPIQANGITFNVSNKTLSIRPATGTLNYSSETRYQIRLSDIKDKNNNIMATETWEFATTTIPRSRECKTLAFNSVKPWISQH
jgi:hypothetical protein